MVHYNAKKGARVIINRFMLDIEVETQARNPGFRRGELQLS